MSIKKLFGFVLFSFALSSCSSNKNASKALQKGIIESYYNIWVSGAAPASSGADFFVRYNPSTEYTVDSFVVNNVPLKVETKTDKQGILIIGRHTTAPNFENPEAPLPKFYSQNKYEGKILLSSNGKSNWIFIDSFEKKETQAMP